MSSSQPTRVPRIAQGGQATAEQWDAVSEHLAATLVPKLAVFGSCDSGKSHLFRMLAAASPLPDMQFTYWDMLSTPQASNDNDFWLTLSEKLGADEPFDKAMYDVQLKIHLADPELPPRVVLVLDHWDDARENSGAFVNLAALEKLSDFVMAQPSTPIATLSRLGLVLVTGFPTVGQLVQYAHEARTPGLLRLSGYIERHFTGVSFPSLSLNASIDFLMARQVEADVAAELAELSGGWLGLLAAAARRVSASGTLDAQAMTLLRLEDLPNLLGKTVLPLLMIGSAAKGDAAALAKFRAEYKVDPGTTIRRYALPSAFGTDSLLPPLLAQFLLQEGVK